MSICICIPKVENSVTKQYISNVFRKHNIGNIYRVNVIQSKEKNNKLAFVYIKQLNDNVNSEIVKNALNDNIDFKIMHNFPNFWKCYKAND